MSFKEQFTRIKRELIEGIVKFLEENNATELPFGEWGFSDTPIIIDGTDDYDTYTLDKITLCQNEDGSVKKVWLACSSSDCNEDVTADKIALEFLADMYEWLMENKDEIVEYLAEEREE